MFLQEFHVPVDYTRHKIARKHLRSYNHARASPAKLIHVNKESHGRMSITELGNKVELQTVGNEANTSGREKPFYFLYLGSLWIVNVMPRFLP